MMEAGGPLHHPLFPCPGEGALPRPPCGTRKSPLGGKGALVTGAGSRIRLGIAACFAADGAQMILADIDMESSAHAPKTHGAAALELDVVLGNARGGNDRTIAIGLRGAVLGCKYAV